MNKPAIAAVAALCSLTASATPSENTFAAVTNDWYNANFTNVYELAQQRLAANSNDVVGAYLMLDWDISFSDIASISNSMTRVITASDAVTNAPFASVYSMLRNACLAYRDEFLPSQTEAKLKEEQHAKSQKPHTYMANESALQLLMQSGLW